jgi:hypothetical protein
MLILLGMAAMAQAWTLPPGAYTAKELGITAPALQDYSVYVSVKNGSLARVEKLLAVALRAQLQSGALGPKFVPVDPAPNDDFPEFDRQLKLAFAGKPYDGLPSRDLYRMAPGAIQRFGSQPTELISELPNQMQGSAGAKVIWRVHRMLYGVFELSSSGTTKDVLPFGNDSQAQFDSLPPEVESLLGADLGNLVKTDANLQKIMADLGSPANHGTSFDPIKTLSAATLQKLGQAVNKDLVIALPDSSLFAMIFDPHQSDKGTVKELLARLCLADNWTVVDGAAVAQLPATEARTRGQARRDILNGYIVAHQADNFIDMDSLSKYVDSQRPIASDTWMDVMLLSISHVGVPEDFIGDYPYNVRLYGCLTNDDWAVLRSGRATRLSALSGPAQDQLEALLVQSRSRMDPKTPDPAFWPSLAPDALVLSAKIEEEPVIVSWITGGAEAGSVTNAAWQYDHVKQDEHKEPLYQMAKRQKLKINIASANGQSVDTGFSNVILTRGEKPVAWKDLPPSVAAQFKTALTDVAAQRHPPTQGTPPPQ